MPKDIRSYFLTTSKIKKSENTIFEEVKSNRKRKKHNIVLSDSDDEPALKSPRKDKKKVPEKKTEETSKYFEVSKETVHKLFGDTPVKRKKAPTNICGDAVVGNRNGEIIDLQDMDDDDDWVSSYFDKCPETQDDSAEAREHVKKRKLNETVTEKDKNKSETANSCIIFTNLASSSERNAEKIVSPRKSGSPQKTLTSYLSPKKKTSPRFNKLDITRSTISPGKVEYISACHDFILQKSDHEMISDISHKLSKKSPEKKSSELSSVKKDLKSALHDISPDISDDELNNDISHKNSTKNCEVSPKHSPIKNCVKTDFKSADHDLSPEISDEESERSTSCDKRSAVEKPMTSLKNNKTTQKKSKVNFKKADSKPVNLQIRQTKEKKSVEQKITKTVTQKLSGHNFELWVDKYRPVNLKNIIGQQGEKSIVNKLLKWLKSWFDLRAGNKKIARPSPWAKDDSGAYFKAALLSGPPGIGKTTTAHLVCKELNMDVVEFNASDTRSKKLLNQEISELLTSKSLSPLMQGGLTTSKKHVLVMDEVDGMAGNEDRGGIQELITLIKNTKIPIICMCNDRNHPKIRSLVNYCFDLRFNRPRVEQIKGAMLSICYKENLKIKPERLVEIISSTNQDIRLVLNHLSILSAKKDQNMNLSNKEIKLGAWDVARKVFSREEHKSMNIHDKSDLFFHDYSIAPLFVQENYLNVIPYSEMGKTKRGKMELFARAADSLCHGDMVDQAIRTQNAWILLPAQAVFSSVIPGDSLSGKVGGMINFPAWLGKNSKRNKFNRLCQEIQVHTRLKVSASKEAICTDYSYALREGIVRSLVSSGSEGVDSSLQFLHEYNLLREDIESLTELTSWPHTNDPFSSLDSKVKAAFTRAYNKRPVLTPFSTNALTKKGRKGSSEDNELEMAVNEEGDELVGSEEQSDHEDDLTTDAMITIKKEQSKKLAGRKETASSSKPRSGKRSGKK